jgi:hypothetical protein
MFVRSSDTLFRAVPPVSAGCHWLLTLSNWLGTAFLFRIGKGIFVVTLAQYQISFGLQEKSSKIFSPGDGERETALADNQPGATKSGLFPDLPRRTTPPRAGRQRPVTNPANLPRPRAPARPRQAIGRGTDQDSRRDCIWFKLS